MAPHRRKRRPTPPSPPPLSTGEPFDFRPVLGTGPFIRGSERWRGEPIKDPENPFLSPAYHYDDDILGGLMGAYRGVVTPEFLMRMTEGPIPQLDLLVQQIKDYLDETREPLAQIREESGELLPPSSRVGRRSGGIIGSDRDFYPKGGRRPKESWWEEFDRAAAEHAQRTAGPFAPGGSRYPLRRQVRRRGK
jgi:hypothetical protein